AKDLDRRPGPQVLFLPIRVRGRSLLILYGDHGHADVDLANIGDVISFSPLAAAALERLIVQRKRGRTEPGSRGSLPPAPPRRTATLPTQEERVHALASVLKRAPKATAVPDDEPFPNLETPPPPAAE